MRVPFISTFIYYTVFATTKQLVVLKTCAEMPVVLILKPSLFLPDLYQNWNM
jgi:hypothetical protein